MFDQALRRPRSPLGETVKDLHEWVLPHVSPRHLRLSERRRQIARHPYPAARVPTVTVRTSVWFRDRLEDPDNVRKTLAWLASEVDRTQHLHSDGLTYLEHQKVPGAVADLRLSNLDHLDTCVRSGARITPMEVASRALDALLLHLNKTSPVRVGLEGIGE